MRGWIESLLLWALLAVLLFWFVGAHNRLVRLRSLAIQSYGVLHALMQRQIDYVQTQTAERLVQAQDASAQELHSLQAANAQLLAVLDATRPQALDPASMAALSTALHVMLSAWERHHPDPVIAFAADGTLSPALPPSQAQHQAMSAPGAPAPLGWPEPNALIEITRAQFNQAVSQYNQAISQFPAVLVAWLFRWRCAAPLL